MSKYYIQLINYSLFIFSNSDAEDLEQNRNEVFLDIQETYFKLTGGYETEDTKSLGNVGKMFPNMTLFN